MGLITLCIVLLSIRLTHCINLDPRFSVVMTQPASSKDSYFGYSLAQHQVTVGNTKTVKDNLLVVGAPKEKVIIQNRQYGGAVYRCDVRMPNRPCTLTTKDIELHTESGQDIEDDRWLGVSVASQGVGGKLVACAHRYIKDNAALGYCTLHSNDFLESSRFMPCQKRSHTEFHKDYGLCQTGISAHLGEDYSFIMGAPGSYIWKGVVFVANVTDELGVTWIETPSPYATAGNEAPGQQPSPTDYYTYNGYAVETGKFDQTKELVYVSGAPKSHNNGEVVFFRMRGSNLRYEPSRILRGPLEFSGFGTSLLVLDMNNDGFDDLIVGAPYFYQRNTGGAIYVYLGGPTMINQDTKPTEIRSRKMGDEECNLLNCEHARFGISLSKIGDVNLDGYQDFAVGAPYEGNGVVYIYHGDNSPEGFNTEYAQRIVAEDLPAEVGILKSFGYSLSGGMDLDGNGYPDLAVGAYESNAAALIRARPIIQLNAEIKMEPMFVDLESPTGCRLRDSTRQCIIMELCLNFTTVLKDSIQITPKVNYRVEAERQRQVARVQLDGATTDTQTVIEGKHMNLEKGNTECVTEVAFLMPDIVDKLTPIEFDFSFDLPFNEDDIEVFPSSSTQDINQFPILYTAGSVQGKENTVVQKVEFVKECGDDNICESNLQFDVSLVNLTKNKDGHHEIMIEEGNTILSMKMVVSNLGEPAYMTRVYVKKHPNMTYDDVVSNDGVECAGVGNRNRELIMCSKIGNPLRDDRVVMFELKLKISKSLAESMQPYPINAWVETASDEQTKPNDNHTLSILVVNRADISIDVTVIPDEPILCEGEPRGASAIQDEIGIGAAVTHSFSVRNRGPGAVNESYLSISWPYEVADPSGTSGKYLLYLMRKPVLSTNVQDVQCNDDAIAQYINPLKIKEVDKSDPRLAKSKSSDDIVVDEVQNLPEDETTRSPPLRRKRETDEDGEVRTLRSRGDVITMSCQDNTAKCFQYSCKIGKMDPLIHFVKVSMESRLWESTLLSDYKKASDVQIISHGKVEIAARLKITQDTSNDFKKAITTAVPDYKEASAQTVQWWIILVAVLVGLVVLLILIFVLYKFGFFKRKRQEDMQMYKAEKKAQPMLTEYDDDVVA